MGRVRYNQAGYVGESMSVNAMLAYKDGEMPKSKWTKKAMLSALVGWCMENDRLYDTRVEGMRKEELWESFFTWKSWHHTGKFARETDFYGVWDEEARERFRALTDGEMASRDEALAEVMEEEARREAARERERVERREAEERFQKKHGYPWWSVKALMQAYPEVCKLRRSRKKNLVVTFPERDGKTREVLAKDAGKARVWGFDGLNPEAFRAVVDEFLAAEN